MTSHQINLNRPSHHYRLPERETWYRCLRWGDFLVAAIVITATVLLLLTAPRGLVGQAQIALLTIDGRTVFSKPLAELQTAGSFTVKSQGYTCVIAYEKGRARFAKADCPDQICVRTGWVSRTGQVAACVPGQMILKIAGPAKSGEEIDIVMQ